MTALLAVGRCLLNESKMFQIPFVLLIEKLWIEFFFIHNIRFTISKDLHSLSANEQRSPTNQKPSAPSKKLFFYPLIEG